MKDYSKRHDYISKKRIGKKGWVQMCVLSQAWITYAFAILRGRASK
jgi:hypothetical protein